MENKDQPTTHDPTCCLLLRNDVDLTFNEKVVKHSKKPDQHLDPEMNIEQAVASGVLLCVEGDEVSAAPDNSFSTSVDEDDFLDLDYLQEILYPDMVMPEMTDKNAILLAAPNECHGGDRNETQAPQDPGKNGKKWIRRRRYKKGTPEYAQRKEEYKIKNRVSAAQAFARKQAYIRDLELQVLKLQEENAYLERLIQLLERTQKLHARKGQLQRTASGPV